MRKFLVIWTLAAMTLTGCSSTPQTSSEKIHPDSARTPSKIPPEAANQSTLDITYMLGHDVHRLRLEATPDQVRARTFMDRQVLKDTQVDRFHYLELLGRALIFIKAARRPASDASCRTPFTLLIQIEGKNESLTGCRTGDEGAQLSRITRDAEFLLYSKK